MKILILALLVVGAAAWPDRRGPGAGDRPSRRPFGRPPPRRGGRPPFLPDGVGPMGGDGDEEWIPPFDKPGFGMGDVDPLRPRGRPPCRRPGKPNGGGTDPELEPEGPAPGPDEGGRGDRIIRMAPESDGLQGGRQGPRQRPDRPQRGGRGKRPGDKPKNRKPKRRRIKPFKGKRLNPEDMENREFFPIFTAENVTLQNATDIPLKAGDNAFLLPMGPRRVRVPEKPEENAPQELFGFGGYGYGGLVPYLNLKYNPSATPTVSFEYGVTQFLG